MEIARQGTIPQFIVSSNQIFDQAEQKYNNKIISVVNQGGVARNIHSSDAVFLYVTWTDPAGTPISNLFAHHLPTAGDANGRDVTDAGGIKQTTPDDGGCSNSLEFSELDGSCRGLMEPVASAPRRTRTFNPLIKSQLLCQLS